MTRRARRRAYCAFPLLVALIAGCGTTLPQESQYQSLASQGLGTAPGSGRQTAPGSTLTPTEPATTGAGQSSSPDGSGLSTTSPTGVTSPVGGTTTHSGHGDTPGTTTSTAGSNTPLVKTPIQIGFMAAASAGAAVAAIGGHAESQETPQQAFGYFVSQLNKRGGIDGRRIEVVQAFINPISSNYDVQAASACADFTQDHHVAVVFSVENAYYSQEFSSCLANAGVPELLAITGGIDPATLAKYPTLFSPAAPTVDRRFSALIKGLSDTGYLSKKTKIGVIVEDCSFNEQAYNAVIVPELKARGFTFYRRDIACLHGFGDAATTIAAIQNQVLPLRSAGVSRVMFVSGFEATEIEYFERQAHLQGYKPGYALTSTSDIGDNTAGFNTAALERVAGVGWEPVSDVTRLVSGTPATQRCHRLWRGFGPAAARSNRQNNDTTCDEFFLLEAALQQTRGNSDARGLEAALQNLGTSYDSPLVLGGATRYGPGDKDGPNRFATFGYQASCHCIGYTSAPKPLA